MRVNLTSVLHATAAILPRVYERDEGHIVNISSPPGVLGVPGPAAYCTSK
jgi:NADP-dependent 3-hydroxy acid dehydrogenase YdfG